MEREEMEPPKKGVGGRKILPYLIPCYLCRKGEEYGRTIKKTTLPRSHSLFTIVEGGEEVMSQITSRNQETFRSLSSIMGVRRQSRRKTRGTIRPSMLG